MTAFDTATAEEVIDETADYREQQVVEVVELEPEPEPEPAPTVDYGKWEPILQCESNGDWTINTGNGYYGGLQFALSSWEWVGGTGYPHEASPEEQIKRAEILLERQGWKAWPACSKKAGYR